VWLQDRVLDFGVGAGLVGFPGVSLLGGFGSQVYHIIV